MVKKQFLLTRILTKMMAKNSSPRAVDTKDSLTQGLLKSVNSDDIHFDFVDEDAHNNESGDTKKFLQKIHKSMKVP